ncbi:Transcriptional regulator, contains XRE-family HTH domain [Actinopolymorpha singaporensis]|uniref:Transcriptional regulator, contains XRE-family HTH domain n=1 Tax=Actinopolymorpha singaporensis TaxID=117157 RepID=A0A1H1RAR2_9ACTN|nr:Transcriptional regulator, contains XRE-family HTH domain [Actinopolymorpha singaporensis]
MSQIRDRVPDVNDAEVAAADGSGPDGWEARLPGRLAELRVERDWSLDELARRTGVSRSTLSRLERAEISPTAALLGKLCSAYEKTMSQLLAEVESESPQLVRSGQQLVWRDEASGFTRRSVSPPQRGLRGEVMEGVLQPGADIPYDRPPVPGQEQHVWVLEGILQLTIDGDVHQLRNGDVLRFRLWGRSRFRNPSTKPVRYVVVIVQQ